MAKNSRGIGIAEIAKACGVSRMTVSRALRHDAAVTEDTRAQIVKAAHKMGYHPKAGMGRPKLVTKERPPFVDVVLATSKVPADMFYSDLLIAIEQELSAHGYDCVIRTTSCEYSEFLWLYQAIERSQPAGTLIVGYMPVTQLSAFLALKPDSILVDYSGDPKLARAYKSVCYDYVDAARQGVRYLLRCGRKRILLIKASIEHCFSRDIEQGYRDIFSEAGIEVDPKLICCADSTPGTAGDFVDTLYAQGVQFDGVFTNDEMALGVLRKLHERGIGCPSDVAVVGCDGLPLGEYTVPSLTTVQLDYRHLGRTAVKLILDDNAKDPAIRRIQFQPTLVVRESTP